MEEEMNKIEDALRNTFSGLPVHSVELMVSVPTEWADLSAPHRYRWRRGKLYRITYDLKRIGENNEVVTEVVRTAKQNDDRLIPLEELRAFMVPHMHRTLPPYINKEDEDRLRGYRQCLYDLMKMLDIETCASKRERDAAEKIYGKRQK